MKIFDYADRVVEFLSSILKNIARVSMVFVVLLVSANVLLRSLNLVYMQFVEEWVGYLTVLMTYFMLSDTLRSGNHITIGLLIQRIPSGRVRHILAVTTSIVGLGLALFFVKEAVSFTVDAWVTSRVSLYTSQSPLWIPRIFIPIGLSVFVFTLAIHTWSLMGKLKKKKPS